MTVSTSEGERKVDVGAEGRTAITARRDGRTLGRTSPTSEHVWHVLTKASFAILSQVNGSGEPRSSGVVYKIVGRHLYVAVAPDGWKAKQIAERGRVAVTVPVRKGGILSLVLPIPPATISFHGTATVYPPGSPQVRSLLIELGSLIPKERQAAASIIEVVPEGDFVTYAIGVPLRRMRDPAAARGRVPAA